MGGGEKVKKKEMTQKGGEFRQELFFDNKSPSTLCTCRRSQVKRQELKTFLAPNPFVLHFKSIPESASESIDAFCVKHMKFTGDVLKT